MSEPDPSSSAIDLGVDGVRVGHWNDAAARTGCTVVLLPEGTVASGEVRGGAPATREFELLAPERLVDRVDAVVLSGGSAFGLAAADGVVQWLDAHDRGFPTDAGVVPIVVAMSLFDLFVGDASVRPTAANGFAAAELADLRGSTNTEVGLVGAGTGATVGIWRGIENDRPSGLGAAVIRSGDVVVAALFAVNAFGDIDDGASVAATLDRVGFVAGASAGDGEERGVGTGDAAPFGNTTIGVVLTNAPLDKTQCLLVAQSGHDGLARSIVPSHARVDGDAIIVAATGALDRDIPVDDIRLMAVAAVEQAVRSLA